MLKARYGLTPDDYVTLWTKQNGCCRICGDGMLIGRTKEGGWKKGCCVDHIRWSKWVRGLLCHRCNTVIGLMNDNPKLLEAAIQYLHETMPHPPK